MPLAVVAIGGNSLIADEQHRSVPDQYQAVTETCVHIAEMIRRDYGVVITHGNGPQVGFILRRSELCRGELHEVPLDSCGADTQGAIGYQIQRALRNEFKRRGMNEKPVTVVTQVLVDKDDPSFSAPSKPIGSFLTEEQAEARRRDDGWEIVEDAGRGYRRVVASPLPLKIVELEAVEALVKAGFTVIAGGGGGIPVIEDGGGDLVGAAAVIDKDRASSLLARKLRADLLVISTGVEKVFLDFGKPGARPVDSMTVAEAKVYAAEGHFKKGSMLPKIHAVIEFLEGGGTRAVITDPAHLAEAVDGKAGTQITH